MMFYVVLVNVCFLPFYSSVAKTLICYQKKGIEPKVTCFEEVNK